MEIDKFLDEYLGDRSEDSRSGYGSDLRRFESFLAELGLSVEEVEPCHIKAYVAWLKTHPNFKTKTNGLSDSTVQRNLAAVRSYYRWLQYYSRNQRNPASIFKFSRSEAPREIDPVDAFVADTMCNGWANKRDIAMVRLFRHSGIRLRELWRMNKIDIEIDPESGEGSAVVLGKRKKRRRVPIHAIVLEAIADYLEERGEDENPALFISRGRGRKRVSRRTIQRTIRSMSLNTAAVHVHPHQFRHSFVTELLDAGVQDVVVQKLAGHALLKTTLGYKKTTDEQIARQYHAAMERIVR